MSSFCQMNLVEARFINSKRPHQWTNQTTPSLASTGQLNSRLDTATWLSGSGLKAYGTYWKAVCSVCIIYWKRSYLHVSCSFICLVIAAYQITKFINPNLTIKFWLFGEINLRLLTVISFLHLRYTVFQIIMQEMFKRQKRKTFFICQLNSWIVIFIRAL